MDMGLIKIWVELGFFQSAIHSFRLSIRPEMTAFRPAVLYVVLPADPIKGITSVLFVTSIPFPLSPARSFFTISLGAAPFLGDFASYGHGEPRKTQLGSIPRQEMEHRESFYK